MKKSVYVSPKMFCSFCWHDVLQTRSPERETPFKRHINLWEVLMSPVCRTLSELACETQVPLLRPPRPSRIGVARADAVIYCGHPSLSLIHHRPVARQQLFALDQSVAAGERHYQQVVVMPMNSSKIIKKIRPPR